MSIKDLESRLRSSTDVWKQVNTLFREVAPWYERIGPGGFLIVSGAILGIMTIVLSFLTGTEPGGRTFGISLAEEIAFMVLAVSLCAMGVLSVRWRNMLVSQEKIKLLEFQMRNNQFLVEQRTLQLQAFAALVEHGEKVPEALREQILGQKLE